MIYVATAHFETARWIKPQLSYLRRNIHEPFEVWASLEDVPGEHDHEFDVVVPSCGPHAGKLNLLAAEIATVAAAQDVIIFLDGDAFPIADPMPVIRRGLEDTVLVAVRRDENATDRQPHPCFCAVRVSDWERIGGDWSPGHSWAAPDGTLVTDVGGNLLRALERTGSRWTPLLRSNRVDLHPLWYGVYGDVAYHHGAGFRWALGRVDLLDAPRSATTGRRWPVVGPVLRRLDSSRSQRFRHARAQAAHQLQDEMFRKLDTDPEFYRQLI